MVQSGHPSFAQPSSVHPYAGLTPEKVLAAVESLGFEADARVFALNSYENRVYQVGIADGSSLIIKFYRPERWSREQILEEHHFTAELARLELPVVPPLPCNGSDTLADYGGFLIAIFPQFIGRPPELDNLDNLLVMGRFIGRIHAVGASRKFKHRVAITPDRFARASQQYLLEHNFIPHSLLVAYESLSRDLIERVEERFKAVSKLTTLRIHGDCHPGNVLWKNDTPTFVDFDDAMQGPAIQDLWMMLSGDRDQRQGQLLELIEGYNEFYDFRVAELALIESLRTMRIMHYSAWLARRWQDPAFPMSFPWFNTERYWAEHILELREQLAALDEPPLQLMQ